MDKSKVKILIATHRAFLIPKGEVFVPIHVGRAVAKSKSKDGLINEKEFNWLLENTIGDDTGDNISEKNRYYCEISAIYWAWKNYEKLGNPDYIGLSQYRRFFCFDHEYFKESPKSEHELGLSTFPTMFFTREDFDKIKLTEEKILEICKENDVVVSYDADLKMAYNDEKSTIRGDYEKNILGVKIRDLDRMVAIVNQKYPEYGKLLIKNVSGYKKTIFNMFIMKKELFFEYCEFLFDILFELEKELDFEEYSTNGKRSLGYLAEILQSCFIWKLEEEKKYTINKYGVTFIVKHDIKL